MRNGFKVFDADSHVIYPADLWERHLDPRFRSRVDRLPPAGLETYNPVRVDGRYTQHTTTLYGQFQQATGWTHDDGGEWQCSPSIPSGGTPPARKPAEQWSRPRPTRWWIR